MDTSARRRRVHRTIEVAETASQYSHDLSMYKTSPRSEINLSEFEELAVQRLQLLRILEEATARGHKPFSDEWKMYVKEELVKAGLKKYLRLMGGYCGQTEQDIEARRTDHFSHFILRLAYCRSEDLRRWFLTREMEWFKLRFIAQSSQGIMAFLQLNNLTYTPIPAEVKDKLKRDLISSSAVISERDFPSIDFYKVAFTDVLPLVKLRRVYVERRYAYIPTSDLIVSVQAQFRAILSGALTVYSQRISNVDDDRLNDLLVNLHIVHTGKTYVAEENTEDINPANLDIYSKQHFPLCMKNLYTDLKTSHHLKHGGRLQLLLFLKGIGLSYENTMEFWRSEFTKNPQMDDNKFQKDHAYNVRHAFGKAGSMTNYSPYSCLKIIMNNIGPGENHGCPFKHWDANILKQKLGEYGLGAQSVSSVMESVDGGHFQIACSKYYECTQGQAPSNMINHPNQFFSESLKLAKEKQEGKKN